MEPNNLIPVKRVCPSSPDAKVGLVRPVFQTAKTHSWVYPSYTSKNPNQRSAGPAASPGYLGSFVLAFYHAMTDRHVMKMTPPIGLSGESLRLLRSTPC